MARGARKLADADAGGAARAPLVLTPVVTAASVAAPAPTGLIGDGWETDPSMNTLPPIEPGSPMGLNMEPTEQPPLEARPGPGAEVPKLLVLLGALWALWCVASLSGASARRLSRVRWPRPRGLRRVSPPPVEDTA